MRVLRGPEPFEAMDFGGKLLGFERGTIKMLRFRCGRRYDVGLEWPFGRQFLGVCLTAADLYQKRADRPHGIRRLVPLADSPTEDHDLFELRIHRTVEAQIGKVPSQPADGLRIQ